MKFFHVGDCGDIIAALPVMRQLGGGEIVIGNGRIGTIREPLKGARYDSIRPLLEAQPYIDSVSYEESPVGITHDFSRFRELNESLGENLSQWQARYFGIKNLDMNPWLYLPKKIKKTGQVLFSRSSRYHNAEFPWKELLEKHKNNCGLVGFGIEIQEFQNEFGFIKHIQTKNLLELAEAISGCELFIGNQSCPCWIAMGLGVPIIQEVWPEHPNSIVNRSNSQFIFTRDQIIC